MAAKASLGLGASLTDRRFRNAAGEPCISRPPTRAPSAAHALWPRLLDHWRRCRHSPGEHPGRAVAPGARPPRAPRGPLPWDPFSAPVLWGSLGGGRRVSRSGLHLPSRRVARLWWRGLRGQTPRHGEAPCPRAGPLPPGSAGHPHAGLAVPARLTPGPSSLRLRGLHLQPVNETRSSSTRGRLPECGATRQTRGLPPPRPLSARAPPHPHPRHRLETPDPRFLPVLAARSQARTREPGRGTGGGVLRERGRSEKHPPPRSGRQARCSAGVLSLGPAPAMTTTRGTADGRLSWVSVEAQGQPHPGSC